MYHKKVCLLIGDLPVTYASAYCLFGTVGAVGYYLIKGCDALRIKLSLSGLARKTLPRDHYHQLSGLIYAMLKEANPSFSEWLHDRGFEDNSKQFKFFCFSRLITHPSEVQYLGEKKSEVHFITDNAALYISSPVREFLENLVSFLLTRSEIRLAGQLLRIESALALGKQHFSESEAFKAVTPIILTKKVEEHTTPFYIRAYQTPEEFDDYLTRNAREKWRIYSGKQSDDLTLKCDKQYLQRKGRSTACKIQIMPQEVMIGSIVPVTVTGSPEEVEFMYDVGLGQKNSFGMGMIEKIGIRY